MDQKLSTQQIQKQVLAPLMQKSINILRLSLMELQKAVEEEIQENPLLETEGNTPQEEKKENSLDLEKLSKLEGGPVQRTVFSLEDDDERQQRFFISQESLEDYLLQQLHIEVSHPIELKIGEQIIGNIDKNGYFVSSCEDVAKKLRLPGPAIVERVLSIIQGFDPPGIAARDIKECLLAQLNGHHEHNGHILRGLIQEHWDDLCKKRFLNIARKMGTTVEEIKKNTKIISTLEPKPGRNFRPLDASIYIKPDVIVKKDADGYQLTISHDGIPPLRISRHYQNLLKRKNLTAEEKEFIENKMQDALNFIRSVKQRSETITAIVRFVMNKQAKFFEEGYQALVPLTLKETARAIDRGESTVSRAIRDKYIDTDRGIFPLKFFFSGGIPTTYNGDVASQGIKEEIKNLIEQEDKNSPLSDKDIAGIFKRKDIHLARRTVAKYRQLLDIPPSHLRKE